MRTAVESPQVSSLPQPFIARDSLLPTLFLSHGSPMQAITPSAVNRLWQQLSDQWTRPTAVLVISAHWESTLPLISSAPNPATIHDFAGFPQALYRLSYPAPGLPALAERIQDQLHAAGLPCQREGCRGFDHGAWVPLRYLYPDADIPVLQLSVQPALPASHHWQIGQALQSLRAEGVLILASGHTTHNLGLAMRAMQQHDETVPAYAQAFCDWLQTHLDQLQNVTTQALACKQLLSWEQSAPAATTAHPTPEHFLPLFVALGAAFTAGQALQAQPLFKGWEWPGLALDSYLFK
ncbi:DODA-type extradiol aromatic ring-opening family dioxygenase [Parvibium lacunae]|uniref:Dioxygenase n=1 Tax=Parvibium lacunae TaxID=1888893 RepID=A0A368L3T7_9BURK|nr:class III extradiol ring-cleavage dioxygenase [Parvibium lacunae]RCS58082.1 dioxygenase [Parvibium lacunae]